ncbi:DNA polymerase lambda [Trichoderma ghanense]|uniref:DNA polymerase lambda n=1 Tax=Trichoderma ghanense TaxID=65468 RepID=A0ABY2GRJ7_9HYPO
MDPDSTESKAAYFSRLSNLSGISDGRVYGKRDDDGFDAREEAQRAHHRRFFPSALNSRPPLQHGQTQKSAQDQAEEQQQPSKQQEQQAPLKANRLRHLTPRKIIPPPRPESAVVKATGPGKQRPKGRLAALLDQSAEAVHETPSVGLGKHKDGEGDVVVVADTPVLPRTSTSLKRPLESASEETSSSPSVNVKAGMTKVTTRGNKRGRMSGPRVRPEEEQIFRGLSFFYVPDNDIAPVRRLRINRAREFGAVWTRDLMAATHVVVEKKLEWKDVEKMLLPREKFEGREMPRVVNEDYPLDCIQFRAIVDAGQRKYLLNGQPVAGAKESEPTTTPADVSVEETTKTKATASSLPLKPAPRNKSKWDYVPPKGTPSQTSESSLSGPRTRNGARRVVAGDSQVVVLDAENGKETTKELPKDDAEIQDLTGSKDEKDELSEYISMMQEFKDLPLDVDEDEDAQSTANGIEAQTDLNHQSEPENDSPQQRRSSRRTRPTSKTIAFEDRFACNRAGRKDANQDNPNARTIEVLQKMNSYYERINDRWRTMAYRKAISILKQQAVKITTEEEAYRLPSIGRRLAQKIEEIVTTDKLKRLEYAEKEPSDHALQAFLGIYGVGNKVAEQWIAQGWRTLDDVRKHAKLTPSQRIGLEHYEDLNTRIPRSEVTALGEVVRRAAGRIDAKVQVIVGGSYRRGAESSNDIDLIVTRPGTESAADLKPFLNKLVDRLERDGFLVARLASSRAGGDGSKWHGCCVLPETSKEGVDGKGSGDAEGHRRPIWRRIDFLLVPESELGAALIYFTGNDIFNRSMRLLASKKGMRLNQRGLYRDVLRGASRARVTEGEVVERSDERRIFEILGVKWREPWERWC